MVLLNSSRSAPSRRRPPRSVRRAGRASAGATAPDRRPDRSRHDAGRQRDYFDERTRPSSASSAEGGRRLDPGRRARAVSREERRALLHRDQPAAASSIQAQRPPSPPRPTRRTAYVPCSSIASPSASATSWTRSRLCARVHRRLVRAGSTARAGPDARRAVLGEAPAIRASMSITGGSRSDQTLRVLTVPSSTRLVAIEIPTEDRELALERLRSWPGGCAGARRARGSLERTASMAWCRPASLGPDDPVVPFVRSRTSFVITMAWRSIVARCVDRDSGRDGSRCCSEPARLLGSDLVMTLIF